MPPKRKSADKTSGPAKKRSLSKDKTEPEGAPASSSSSSSLDVNKRPIFFWKPQEAETGYLSQWFALPFRDKEDPSKIYPTAEHYMMHHKALLFGDTEIAGCILETRSPRDVRQLGRAVRGFDPAVWERERERIVVDGNWCKFTLPVVEEDKDKDKGTDDDEDEDKRDGKGQADRLRTWKLGHGDKAKTFRAASFRDVLLATGDRELVEASSFDKIWGIGFAAKGAEEKRHKWGMNLLGKCLMAVREQFRKDAEVATAEDSRQSSQIA